MKPINISLQFSRREKVAEINDQLRVSSLTAESREQLARERAAIVEKSLAFSEAVEKAVRPFEVGAKARKFNFSEMCRSIAAAENSPAFKNCSRSALNGTILKVVFLEWKYPSFRFGTPFATFATLRYAGGKWFLENVRRDELPRKRIPRATLVLTPAAEKEILNIASVVREY